MRGTRALSIFHRNQSGLTLISIIVILMIMGIFMTWISTRMMHVARVKQGEILGRDLMMINKATQNFATRFHLDIKTAALNAVDNNRKTIDLTYPQNENLPPDRPRALNAWVESVGTPGNRRQHLEISGTDLDMMFAAIAASNGNTPGNHSRKYPRPNLPDPTARYVVRLTVVDARDPADMRCKADRIDQCHIESLVYLNKPIISQNNRPDYVKLNAAIGQMGNGSGYSLPDGENQRRAHIIRFSRAMQYDANNAIHSPLPGTAGVLAIHQPLAVGFLPHLRADGSDKMHGNLSMEGYGIENMRYLSGKKNASGVQQAIFLESNKTHIGHLPDADQNDGPPLPAPDVITIENGKLQSRQINSKKISASSMLQTEHELNFSKTKNIGTPCTDSAIAVDAAGSLLHCRNTPSGATANAKTWQSVEANRDQTKNHIFLTREMLENHEIWGDYLHDYARGFSAQFEWIYPGKAYSKSYKLGVHGPNWACEKYEQYRPIYSGPIAPVLTEIYFKSGQWEINTRFSDGAKFKAGETFRVDAFCKYILK